MRSPKQENPQYPNERVILRALIEDNNGSRHLWTIISTATVDSDVLDKGVRASAAHTFPAMGMKLLKAERVTDASVEL
jgi:hypothetical protein